MMKYKYFCDVNCRNSCHKTTVSVMTALYDILATSLVFLNFIFCLWQNILYPLKHVISDLTTQCKFTASCV